MVTEVTMPQRTSATQAVKARPTGWERHVLDLAAVTNNALGLDLMFTPTQRV